MYSIPPPQFAYSDSQSIAVGSATPTARKKQGPPTTVKKSSVEPDTTVKKSSVEPDTPEQQAKRQEIIRQAIVDAQRRMDEINALALAAKIAKDKEDADSKIRENKRIIDCCEKKYPEITRTMDKLNIVQKQYDACINKKCPEPFDNNAQNCDCSMMNTSYGSSISVLIIIIWLIFIAMIIFGLIYLFKN